jgi:hypothetical protein
MRLKRLMFFLVSLFLAVLSFLAIYAAAGFENPGHFEYIRKVILDKKFDAGKSGLDDERSIITFSFLSEGVAGYAEKHPEAKKDAAAILEKCVSAAMADNVCQVQSLEDTTAWLNNNLYLSHLNILLGSYQRLTGSDKYHDLHSRISTYLAQHLLESPAGNIRSYPGMKEVWPADNAATLHSLWLYDRLNKTGLHVKPARNWLAFMSAGGTDPKTRLHRSELLGITRYSRYPRGCALSWSAKYMGGFAPKEAHTLWSRYKKLCKINFVVAAAFREYQPGVNLGMDYDTGPIILGMGSAATGLAVPAAAWTGDWPTLWQLRCSMAVVDVLVRFVPDEDARQVAGGLLARSIRLNGLGKI